MGTSTIPRIQHNIVAMNAYRNYSANSSALSKNLEKLSSGFKINRAGDDAAGLAISEKMRAQISGLSAAKKNATDGISLIQTAEGAMTEVHDMLNRMVTLTEQSANGTYADDVDREQLQKEVDALKSEINRVADSTNFNGLKLLDGSLSGSTAASDSVISGNLDSMMLDATKAKSVLTFDQTLGTPSGTLTAGTDVSDLDGTSLTLSASLSDGSSMDVKLNFVKDGTDMKIKTEDGTEVGSFATTDAADDIQTALADSFRKAIKADEALGGKFKGTATESDVAGGNDPATLTLEAKNAGSDGVYIKSVELTADKGTSTSVTTDDVATFWNASNDPNNVGQNVGTGNGSGIKADVTKGQDATLGFRAEDLTLYNDNYVDATDGHKGNADKAVFEINGKKFAVGTANQRRDNLPADVTFISLDTTSVGAAGSSATGGVALKEEVGTGTSSEISSANQSAAGTAKFRDLSPDALKHVASELAKELGVEVNFDNTSYTQDIAGTATVNEATQVDDGEDLTTNNANQLTTNQNEVPMFTIGKKAGTEGKSLTLQIGDTADKFNQLSVSVKDMHTKAMGIDDVDISTQEGAAAAMDKIKSAVNYVSDVRGGLGALQNRLDHTINNLGVMIENIQSAEGAIRDTDVAEEMMAFTKNTILNQSAQAMLAQANQLPQGVLQLIG